MKKPLVGHVDLTDIYARLDALERAAAPVPTPTPTPAPLPPPVHELPKDTIDAADVMDQLARHDRVDLKGIDTIIGTIEIAGNVAELVCTEGNRPVIMPERGRNAIVNTSQHVERLLIDGIAGYTDNIGTVPGIQIRINGQDGKFVRDLEIRDVKIEGFDDNILVVDDWARSQPSGTPGRIMLTGEDCILHRAVSSDNHSSGLYVEGLAERSSFTDSVIWRVGWTDDGTDPREKRSHCIYAQQFGAPLIVYDLYLGEPCAAGLMMRRGGFADRVVISGASTPVVMFGSESSLHDSAIIDHMDIGPAPDEERIKAVNVWDTPSFTMSGNVIARRRGRALNRPVVAVGADYADVQNNTIAAWPSGIRSFDINGETFDGLHNNRVLANDPGVPAVGPALLHRLLNRERGQAWAPGDTPDAFVKLAQEAVQ